MGVTDGFTKTLDIKGVGYRAAAQGRNLKLQLGYSHDVDLAIPEGLDVKTPEQAACRLLDVIDHMPPARSGGFFDHRGDPVAW